ncbi:MAG: Ldh family oxidoreductase, partial [Gammaproteobacteria bacterium]|nr:Ldh family oxidoreductase [Gammaproteobacteria bacterium]
LHVGPAAMELAMDKADEFGIGAVAVQNCGHVGMLAYYPLMAIERDMIGVCMVSAGGSIMVPTFGAEPAFGTQPIAWAAPADQMPPFVFDVATTQVAANKLMLARRIGSKLEPGWITGLDGDPIMEPVDAPNYGDFFMLPFGGTRENGGHKGFGFAVIADIMSGILSGNGPGFIAEQQFSQFVMAFRIDAFLDVAVFKSDMDKLLGKLANTKPAPGHDRVYYAGLMEHEEVQRRTADGIPYHKEVVDWFNSASAELKLNFALP